LRSTAPASKRRTSEKKKSFGKGERGQGARLGEPWTARGEKKRKGGKGRKNCAAILLTRREKKVEKSALPGFKNWKQKKKKEKKKERKKIFGGKKGLHVGGGRGIWERGGGWGGPLSPVGSRSPKSRGKGEYEERGKERFYLGWGGKRKRERRKRKGKEKEALAHHIHAGAGEREKKGKRGKGRGIIYPSILNSCRTRGEIEKGGEKGPALRKPSVLVEGNR